MGAFLLALSQWKKGRLDVSHTFEWGPITLHTYGLLVGIGIYFGMRLLVWQAKQDGVSGPQHEDSFYQLFYLVICGLLGGRIFHVVIYRDEFAGDWLGIFKVWRGGLVSYGGLIGVAAGFGLWYRKHREHNWKKVLDWLAASMAFAHAVGRLGCFFAGCCYGTPADLPWCVVFTDPQSLARLDIPLHPTQIYESVFLFALGAFLLALNNMKRRRHMRDGLIFANYLFIYSIARFLLEYVRGDYLGNMLLTSGQTMSLAVMALSAGLTIYLTRNTDSVNLD